MAIRFRRVSRLCDPTNKEAGKKVYPVISYQYDTSATLDEFAKEISSASGVSEGETISVLKDFRTLLRKTLLSGRSVNIAGLGYFYLAAQSKGTDGGACERDGGKIQRRRLSHGRRLRYALGRSI